MINITDLHSGHVTVNTPIIKLNLQFECLNKIGANLFAINVKKMRSILSNYISFAHMFVPVGLVELTNQHYGQNIPVILANITIIPTTSTYDKIAPNVFIGILKIGNTQYKSIGTFTSQQQISTIPVFTQEQLGRQKGASLVKYYNVYADPQYKRELSNEHKMMHQKVYFTTQGEIAKDNNCTSDNVGQIFLDECNCKYEQADELPHPFDALENSAYIIEDEINNEMKVIFGAKPSRKLILKENENPWFLDESIVGDMLLSSSAPHKITGLIGELNNSARIDKTTDINGTNNDDGHKFVDINNYIIVVIMMLILCMILIKYHR